MYRNRHSRFWEKEFEGILVPLRTNGGQSRYAPEHVSVVEEIKILKKAGLSLAEIKRKLGKGQMSVAGSQGVGDERPGGIDLLADRVAEVVKSEVLRFFESGHGQPLSPLSLAVFLSFLPIVINNWSCKGYNDQRNSQKDPG